MNELVGWAKRKFIKANRNMLDESETVFVILCKTKNGNLVFNKEDADKLAEQLVLSGVFDKSDIEVTKLVGKFFPQTYEQHQGKECEAIGSSH